MFSRELVAKFIDFFAGIGGVRTGFEQAGMQCVGYVEIDKYARQSYQAIYDTKGEYTEHDIRDVKGQELPEADLWSFSSPCQNVSIAGTRTGLGGSNPVCFLRLSDALKKEFGLKKRCLPLFSWKTCATCYQAIKDGTLPKCSFKWNQSGTMWNGQLLTQPQSFPNTENESMLSDILQKEVPDRYFLSRTRTKALAQNLSDKWETL